MASKAKAALMRPVASASLLSALLAATVLAGCAAEGGGAPIEEVPDLGLEATSTTGVIRGVVVDEAIRPVAGVTILAKSADVPERQTTTEETGFFGFDGLEPGTWFLTANRTGYFATQASSEVVAGVAEPAVVKIQLVRDVANLPYAVLNKFEGYLECGLSVIALCGAADAVTNDRFAGTVTVEKPPMFIQSEMVWTPTTSASDQLWIWHSRSSKETGGYDGSCNCWVQGVSPLVMTTNQTIAEQEEYGNETDLYLRIFTGSIEGTRNPLSPEGCYPGSPGPNTYCGGVGYSLQQPFTVYTTIFYGYLPPEGWLFVETNGLPEPPA